MSIFLTMGRSGALDTHAGFNFSALATADRTTLSNAAFDGARGASSALWRGGDAANPGRASRSSMHLSVQRSRSSSGMRLAGRPSIRGESRGESRGARRARASKSSSRSSLPALEDARGPPRMLEDASIDPRRARPGSADSLGGLSLGSVSGADWFGSRPSSREGPLETSSRRARTKARPKDPNRPFRKATGAYAMAGAYEKRPDPWLKHRATRAYEKAAEAERAASAWADPELQEWLAAKDAQEHLGVGTWAGESARLDGQANRVVEGSVPKAPLNRWHPRKEARLAETRHGFSANQSARDGEQLVAEQLSGLTAQREAAAQRWEDAHRDELDPRLPTYIHDDKLAASGYQDAVCGYRRGGDDGSYSFFIDTGTDNKDLLQKRRRAAALWDAYENAYEPVDDEDDGHARANFSAIYATEEEADETRKMSEWVTAKRAEHEAAEAPEGTEKAAFDEAAATVEWGGITAAEKAANAEPEPGAAEEEEVLLRECVRAICQAVDAIHTDEWNRENNPVYTLELEGSAEEDAAAARMQAIQRGRTARRQQLAMKKGNAIFGPLMFNALISKVQKIWRAKMQRRIVKKDTLSMQMNKSLAYRDRDLEREEEAGAEPEPEPEAGAEGGEPEPEPEADEGGADIEKAQAALDVALKEQKTCKKALDKPKKPLKKKAKAAAREALKEADGKVADAERVLCMLEKKAASGPAEVVEEKRVLDYAWLVEECTGILGRGGAGGGKSFTDDENGARELAKQLQEMVLSEKGNADLQAELFDFLDDPKSLDEFIPGLMGNRRKIGYAR